MYNFIDIITQYNGRLIISKKYYNTYEVGGHIIYLFMDSSSVVKCFHFASQEFIDGKTLLAFLHHNAVEVFEETIDVLTSNIEFSKSPIKAEMLPFVIFPVIKLQDGDNLNPLFLNVFGENLNTYGIDKTMLSVKLIQGKSTVNLVCFDSKNCINHSPQGGSSVFIKETAQDLVVLANPQLLLYAPISEPYSAALVAYNFNFRDFYTVYNTTYENKYKTTLLISENLQDNLFALTYLIRLCNMLHKKINFNFEQSAGSYFLVLQWPKSAVSRTEIPQFITNLKNNLRNNLFGPEFKSDPLYLTNIKTVNGLSINTFNQIETDHFAVQSISFYPNSTMTNIIIEQLIDFTELNGRVNCKLCLNNDANNSFYKL